MPHWNDQIGFTFHTRRRSSSSSPVWTSPMVFHQAQVRRSELRRTVSCGTSMGWGLLIGWEGVFSRFLLRSLLQASKAAAEDRSCGRRGGEGEQRIPLGDLVVISYICGGLFVSWDVAKKNCPFSCCFCLELNPQQCLFCDSFCCAGEALVNF